MMKIIIYLFLRRKIKKLRSSASTNLRIVPNVSYINFASQRTGCKLARTEKGTHPPM